VSSARDAGRAVLVAEAGTRVRPEGGGRPGQDPEAGGPRPWPRVSSLTVERLMRVGPHANQDDRLAAAAARMRGMRAEALIVVDRGVLLGLISDRDLLRAVADGFSTDAVPVADYMRLPPCAIGASAQVSEAAARMIEHRVRHLPVVRDGQVLGVISARDVLEEWGVPPELLGDDMW
jgi:CBS domain-containing protein